MLKYACYIRVSTDKLEQASSIENQKALFENYIYKNGGKLYRIYQDIETGTKADRKGLLDLLDSAQNYEFDVLLIKDWSRFSRNVSYSFVLKEKFEELSIPIINVSTGTNVLEEDTLIFAVNSAMAQKESERVSERTKMAFIAKAYRGEFKGSRPPYGYYSDNGKLFIRNDNSPNVVRLIFNMYLNGAGSDKIAHYLNDNNIPTPSQLINWKRSGILWCGSTIDKILRNPHYIGNLAQCRSTTIRVSSNKRNYFSPNDYIVAEDTHEAIISKDIFYKVQETIKKRHKEKRKATTHLFSNLLYCEDCGRRLHYKANSKGYVCGGFNRHGSNVCSRHFIKEEFLENLLLNDINKISSTINNSQIINKIKVSISKKRNALDINIKNLDKKINALNSEKLNILRLFSKSEISKEQFNFLDNEISNDLSKLEIEKTNILKMFDDESTNSVIKDLYNLSTELSNITKLDNKILNELVEKIVIKDNGTPIVYYTFSALFNFLDDLGFFNKLRNTFNVHSMREHINWLNFCTTIPPLI